MSDEKDQTNNQNEELEKAKKQAEEYLNNWKKERADFLNYKKDEAKRMEEFVKFANESTILEVFDLLDNLEMAFKHVPPSTDAGWLEGLIQIQKDFMEFLKKYGVERIKVEGKFDPILHEIIGEGEGESVEEIRAGYTMYGKVIRPTRVRIVK